MSHDRNRGLGRHSPPVGQWAARPTGQRPALAGRLLVLSGAGLFLISGLALGGFCLRVAYTSQALGEDRASGHTTPTGPLAPGPLEWERTLAELRKQVATPRGVVHEARPRAAPGSPSQVNQAIDRGVSFLRAEVVKLPGDDYGGGVQALIALALLECGVPADDPVLAKTIAGARARVPLLNGTYQLAVTLLLLDRLGGKGDEALIRTLALQLIASQNVAGGWDYPAPPLTGAQQAELNSLLLAGSVVVGGDPKLAQLPAVRYRRGQKVPWKGAPRDDNSATQFATIALWVARKHGVPVDRPLALVGARFRDTQAGDGSWGYSRPDIPSDRFDSMTCAGLLGLAVSRGVDPAGERQPGSATDRQAEKALRYLSRTLRRAVKEPIPNPNRPKGLPIGAFSDGDMYYLWSLERVGVLYDLRTIGGEDWHAWGTKLLLAVQNRNGSWSDRWGEPIGTCFALLFLKRVNVAEDLTARLNLLGKVKDPFPERTPLLAEPTPKGPVRVGSPDR